MNSDLGGEAFELFFGLLFLFDGRGDGGKQAPVGAYGDCFT